MLFQSRFSAEHAPELQLAARYVTYLLKKHAKSGLQRISNGEGEIRTQGAREDMLGFKT